MDRHVYLKIEQIASYNPVNPEPKPAPPRAYKRDCMRNPGHDDGTIPPSEVSARALSALIYREYLDSAYHFPKPDKLVIADVNEPLYYSRVPRGGYVFTDRVARPGAPTRYEGLCRLAVDQHR